jgi:hypothetical protein
MRHFEPSLRKSENQYWSPPLELGCMNPQFFSSFSRAMFEVGLLLENTGKTIQINIHGDRTLRCRRGVLQQLKVDTDDL